MNRFHRRYCASEKWNTLLRGQLLPDVVRDMQLGDHLLELGPGPGLTTLAMAPLADRVTAIEIDPELAAVATGRTEALGNVEVLVGDATALPFPDGQFSSVLCMTMLHHLPDAAAQDRLFAEACRVLRPGGVFGGSDNLGKGLRFKLIHIGDTRTVVSPDTLPARLRAAGFDPVSVTTGSRLVFHGRRPEPAAQAT